MELDIENKTQEVKTNEEIVEKIIKNEEEKIKLNDEEKK